MWLNEPRLCGQTSQDRVVKRAELVLENILLRSQPKLHIRPRRNNFPIEHEADYEHRKRIGRQLLPKIAELDKLS